MDDWLEPIPVSRGSNTSAQEHAPSTMPPSLPSPSNSTPSDNPSAHVSSSDISATSSTEPLPPAPTTVAPETSSDPPSPGLPEVLGRGQRSKKPSILLKNYVTHTTQATNPPPPRAPATSYLDPSVTVSGKTLYPIANYLCTSVFTKQHQAFLATITTESVPKTYSEAVRDPRFNGAMKTEITALEDNHTSDVTELPPGRRAIGCQWLFSKKYNADGTIERPKARLVARGNRQREGFDYKDTFTPVAKMNTVRFLLAISAAQRWEVHQMDVHNAFLHGDLEEEIYMQLPPGFQSSKPNQVCRLRKSFYGLKQAARCWFSKLSKALLEFGFVQSRKDYSLFSYVNNTKNICLHILVYVDDFIIAGNDIVIIQRFKTYLNTCFKMKDLGKLKYFLGLEVVRGPEGIFVSQRKYTLDIVAECGLLGYKPSPTPTELNHKLVMADDTNSHTLLSDPHKYRRLVGRLIYLTFTRPDLNYIIHILSQFMQKPLEEHWQAALRVVRYLKGSPDQGIMLRADCNMEITAYCNADWSSCPSSR